MSADLKPCPFCGSAAEYDSRHWEPGGSAHPMGYTGHAVYCSRSGCNAKNGLHETEEEAVEAWNQRAALRACAQAEPATQTQDWIASILRAGLSEPPTPTVLDSNSLAIGAIVRWQTAFSAARGLPDDVHDGLIREIQSAIERFAMASDPGREARDAVLEEAAQVVERYKIGEPLVYGSVTEAWIARAIRALKKEPS